MKFLIAGLGNIGAEYAGTRHNIGFIALDSLCAEHSITFEKARYSYYSALKIKGKTLILIKPSTFMNLSGRAVKYWLNKENIPTGNLLVVLDDVSLPFGTIRMRSKGNNGGHNGLKDIDSSLETDNYSRLRFGVGDNFQYGRKAEYVLNEFTPEETRFLPGCLKVIRSAITDFALAGISYTMNKHNGPVPFS